MEIIRLAKMLEIAVAVARIVVERLLIRHARCFILDFKDLGTK